MFRFLSGIFWGGLVGVVGMGVLSLTTGVVEQSAVVVAPEPAPDAAAASSDATDAPDAAAAPGAADPLLDGSVPPDTAAQIAVADPVIAETPETTGAGDTVSEDATPGVTPQVSTDVTPDTTLPVTPADESAGAGLQAQTADPVAPDASDAVAPAATAAVDVGDTAAAPATAQAVEAVIPSEEQVAASTDAPVAPVTSTTLIDTPAPAAASNAPVAPTAALTAIDTPQITGVSDPAPTTVDLVRPVVPSGDAAPAVADLPPPPPLTPEEQKLLDAALAAPFLPQADAAATVIVDLPAPDAPVLELPAPDASAAQTGAAETAAAQSPVIDAPAPSVPQPADTAPSPSPAPIVIAEAPEPTVPVEPAPSADPLPRILTPDAQDEAVLPGTPVFKPAPGFAPAGRLAPASGLPGRQAGLQPSRLAPDAAAEGNTPTDAADTPLSKYAQAFANAQAKPLFALVLVDTGGPDVDRTALAELPFPVTFAIDPAAPDAALAAEIYRAAGQEVVMLATGIPPQATAADLEQTFQINSDALPQAVAVMDTDVAGFADDRTLSTLVVPVIAGQGRGILTWARGLNAGDQVARRAGVPAATIFRNLDNEGESVPVQRRYLDRAAFKAAQDGRVVVAGHTRPDTVKALLEWTVEGRADQVALAPLSAVLTKN